MVFVLWSDKHGECCVFVDLIDRRVFYDNLTYHDFIDVWFCFICATVLANTENITLKLQANPFLNHNKRVSTIYLLDHYFNPRTCKMKLNNNKAPKFGYILCEGKIHYNDDDYMTQISRWINMLMGIRIIIIARS